MTINKTKKRHLFPKQKKPGGVSTRQPSREWIWLIVILLIVAAVFPFVAAYLGQPAREEVVPTPIIQPTFLPFPSPEPTVEPTVTVEPTAEPTVAPTLLPVESWQSAITFYLLTGLREEKALEAARKIAQLNPDWASEYAKNTLETLVAYYNISAWELEKYQRFARLASAFDPAYQAKIQAEMERLSREIELAQKAQAQAQKIPEEMEIPEKIEIDLAPATGRVLGLGVSPESFHKAYALLKGIPHESQWRVLKIRKTPFLFLEILEITFQRVGPGNPQTTWFKGIFLGNLKEGDVVSGKNLLDLLFP